VCVHFKNNSECFCVGYKFAGACGVDPCPQGALEGSTGRGRARKISNKSNGFQVLSRKTEVFENKLGHYDMFSFRSA